MSATSAANLSAVFKAYDVRGTVPDQVDEELARAVGSAFVTVTGSSATTCGPPHPGSRGPSRRALPMAAPT